MKAALYLALTVVLFGMYAAAQPASPFAGLIVDVRGLKFTPCMFPRLYSDNGTEVWGSYSVSSQYANDIGVASFVRDLETAATLKDRGGPNQLIVRAVRVSHQCDATLDATAAERVRMENNAAQFFEKFRITFVY